MAPATLVVLIIAPLLLIAGAVILASARTGRADRRCPACGWANQAAARFCARCGHALGPPDVPANRTGG